MWKAKYKEDTLSFQRNIKARKTEGLFSFNAGLPSAEQATPLVSGLLHGDPNTGVWAWFSDDKKSDLSKSVASIALCDGDTTLFSCSGIAMLDPQEVHLTKFLTSASLVRELLRCRTTEALKIQVRHEGNTAHEGILVNADLYHNFAVLDVRTNLDIRRGYERVLEIPPHGDVSLVSLGRDICGKVITRTVKLSGDLSVSEDDEGVDSKISEVSEGGPLFSSDGYFAGMNLYLTTRRAYFVPWNIIFEHLKQQIPLPLSNLIVARYEAIPLFAASNIHLEANRDLNHFVAPANRVLNQEHLDLDSMGYPKLPSTMFGDGMILVNTFEETFGDIFDGGDGGVWGKLSRKAVSKLNRNVVALASYNGNIRFFACTGFFIEWNGSTVIMTSASLVRNPGEENKIFEDLRIIVCLPNGLHKDGKLLKFSLHYNVALVSVDYIPQLPANVQVCWDSSRGVAAVGRCFRSNAIMAMTGWVVSGSGTLDCENLLYSSCKITKVGIGGPLVTLDGDVIGMNFYDRIGTPFLAGDYIRIILESFEGKSEAGNDINLPCVLTVKDSSVRLVKLAMMIQLMIPLAHLSLKWLGLPKKG